MISRDRWWIAYLALCSALVIRAPSWGWAVAVVAIWAVVLPFAERVDTWRDRQATTARKATAAADWQRRHAAGQTTVLPRVPVGSGQGAHSPKILYRPPTEGTDTSVTISIAGTLRLNPAEVQRLRSQLAGQPRDV